MSKSRINHSVFLSIFNNVSLYLKSSFVFSVSEVHRTESSLWVRQTCMADVKCLTAAPEARRVSQDTLVELKALADIIQSSVQQIEEVVIANSFSFPSPDSTFSPESEAPRMYPVIQSAGSLITAAAAQLMTLVRPVPSVLFDISMQVSMEAPLHYCRVLLTTCKRSSSTYLLQCGLR